MSNYVDISVAISPDIPTWPDTPAVKLEKIFSIANGDSADDTVLNFSVHTGTHIDAPCHFISGGKSVDQISLDLLVGDAFVADLPDHVKVVTPEILESLSIPIETTRLLLKTHNSKLWENYSLGFCKDFVALSRDAAQWVVERNIKLIGIDYLSIQRFEDGPETHQILLGSEVVIIEGLNLSEVKGGIYELICLPIKLKDVEGSPARVILRKT